MKRLISTITKKIGYPEIGLFFFYIAVFSGRFSPFRLGFEFISSEILEVQIWATILALILLSIFKKNKIQKDSKKENELKLLILFLFVFFIYLLANYLIFGINNSLLNKLKELILISLQIIIIYKWIRVNNDLIKLAIIAETFSLLLFLFALFRIGYNHEYGAGWSVFGTTFTYHRIQLFGFCSAIYCYFKNKNTIYSYLHILISILILYSVISTLSKGPIIAMIIIFFLLAITFISIKKYKELAIYLLITFISVSLFVAFSSKKGYISDKIIAMGLRQKNTTQFILTSKNLVPSIDKYKDKEIDIKKDMEKDSDSQILIKKKPNETNEQYLARLDATIMFFDFSGRIRMYIKAIKLFLSNKFFGIGMGNYTCTIKVPRGEEKYGYPHNFILEILSGMGIIGFFFFLLPFLYSIVLLVRLTMSSKSFIHLIIYPIFILIIALFSGDIYDFRIYWIVSFIILCTNYDFDEKGNKIFEI